MVVAGALSVHFLGRGRTNSMRTASILYALVLLVAAALKTHALLQTHGIASSFAGPLLVPAWTTWLAIVLECLLAAWLLAGIATNASRRATMAVLVIFLIVSGYHLVARHADCGCFGNVRVHPALTFALNLTALGVFAWVERTRALRRALPAAPAGAPMGTSWAQIGVGLAVAASFPLAATATALLAPDDEVVVIDPQSSRGKVFPLLAFTTPQARADLVNGRRTVIVFSRTCKSCQGYLEGLRASASGADDIRLVDISEESRPPLNAALDAYPRVPLRKGVLYVADVPLKVSLNRGVVEAVRRP